MTIFCINILTGDHSVVQKNDSSSELRKLKEQCVAQEEEIELLVGQIETMKKTGLKSPPPPDANRKTSRIDVDESDGDDIQGLRREINNLKIQLNKEKSINKQIRTEYKSNNGTSAEEKLAMEEEVDELKCLIKQGQNEKNSLEKELKRMRTIVESSSEAPDAVQSTLVLQLRHQLEAIQKDRDEKERALIEIQNSSEIAMKELSVALEDSKYKAETNEKYLRQQLDVLTRESTAEITLLREELEDNKSALRRQMEAYQSMKDNEEELKESTTATLSEFKEQAASCEKEMKYQMTTMQDQLQKNIAGLQDDLKQARKELREAREKHSEAIITERSNAEKILLSSIQAVKDQASEMEESLKKMHRLELAAKTKEINELSQFYEENRAKLISTSDSGGYSALVSVLTAEMILLKETMTKYMSWDSTTKGLLNNSNVHSTKNSEEIEEIGEIDDIALEAEPNEDGIITGAISIVMGEDTSGQREESSDGNMYDPTGSSVAHSSSHRTENEELCQVLLSSLQKCINVLEYDPYSDPDSPYMKQTKELETLKLSYRYDQESLISQKLDLKSTKSALETLREETNNLKLNLESMYDQTIKEIQFEEEKAKKELEIANTSVEKLEKEKEKLNSDLMASQEELIMCRSAKRESENKLCGLQLRMDAMRSEYEEETKRMREKLEKIREEGLIEANQRLDIIEAEKARYFTFRSELTGIFFSYFFILLIMI